MADEGPQLTLVGKKSLGEKCKHTTLAYCPSMDLVALVTTDEELRVFRLNGQRVIDTSFPGDAWLDLEDEKGEVRTLAWKANGHLLAVACGDASLRVLSAYSGKTVHHYQAYNKHIAEDLSPSEHTLPKITCLGWGMNFTDSKAAQQHLQESGGQVTLEELLCVTPSVKPSKALLKANLPRELALFDADNSLPKLSVLPTSARGNDLFSSRASIDAIFHSVVKDTSDTVDVLVTGFNNGSIHLRIFDCFEIGSIPVGASTEPAEPCSVIRHASHPLSSTHALVISPDPSKSPSPSPLKLVTLDLRFITKSGRYLSLLASKTTQLQNLLRYIGQVQHTIEMEWRTAQELPARFLRTVNMDLEEHCQCDFVTAIYHLLVFGHCFAPMREFLVDIVGDRGHKRWEKAVAGGYETIRRLTHECLLPALERSQILLGRLIGLSKFSKLSDVLGLDTPKLNGIAETLSCLHVLAQRILGHANDELVQFAAFSRWLYHEIAILNAEPLSQTLEDLAEKRDQFNLPLTTKYIKGALQKSVLRNFIRQLPIMGVPSIKPTPPTDKWLPDGHDGSFYDQFMSLLDQQRQAQDQGGDGTSVDSPKMSDLTRRLGKQFDRVFEEIALTQRRSILNHCPLVLHSDCEEEVLDAEVCYEDAEQGNPCSIYVVSRSRSSHSSFYIYRTVLDSVNGVSSTRSTSVAAVSFEEGEILQLRFVNDNTIALLWRTTGEYTLNCWLSNNPHSQDANQRLERSYFLNFPFQPTSVQSQPKEQEEPTTLLLDYIECDSNPVTPGPNVPTTRFDLSSLNKAGAVRHVFNSAGAQTNPIWMDVNVRKGRRPVCVLYEDKSRYDVFDLDGAIEKEDDEQVEEDKENVDRSWVQET
ncbi:Anaphase-promoting complex subunit 4 [Penicillium argentinense]|uniref:Anaphase-promoting complex subunit 4 n=1 Tax=Penicillium argentinense TaxID=1131581 RepID=A0A9W9EWG7_9EURO|nr:Anaphase-promoting complex subunit 4 [Penicillium argentinense]KAJ5089257.1 Anaphase-promoting complex subunit 4 [Penicillium argentinense]